MECDVTLLFNSKDAYHSAYKVLSEAIDAHNCSMLSTHTNLLTIEPVSYTLVYSIIDKWSKEHSEASCWLEYKTSQHLIPDNNAAAIGIRAYENGSLVYSMDGSMILKSHFESEQTTVDGEHLHLCKQDAKSKTIVIDGIIDIDVRDVRNTYVRFVHTKP